MNENHGENSTRTRLVYWLISNYLQYITGKKKVQKFVFVSSQENSLVNQSGRNWYWESFDVRHLIFFSFGE